MLHRRLMTIPAYVLVTIVWIAAVPIWLPVAVIVDISRPRNAFAVRCGVSVTSYLLYELVGLIVAAAVWSRNLVLPISDEAWRSIHFRLEAWWGDALFKSVVWCFRLRVEVEGTSETDARLGTGPYLLLLRHASTADTLLASALVSRPYGLRLRYVLKKELLIDPCLDVVGNRLPNAFVDRTSSNTPIEIQKVQALAHDLGPRDGVLIYPEGTRFSSGKRARVIERFRERGDEKMLTYAESLNSVLPPRSGGVLGLLEAAPNADVVFCAHTGFEGAASLGEIWRGALLGRVIRVRFKRVPRNLIPQNRDEQIDWLQSEWRGISTWIDDMREQETK